MRSMMVLLLTAPLAAAPMELSLKRAVQLAVSPEGSTRVQLSMEQRAQAEAHSHEVRAALLPDLSGGFAVQNQTRNLAAFGLQQFSLPIPGMQFPSFVGPFSTLDARFSVTQNVFDFASIRRYQASKTAVKAARSELGNTEEQVAARVARAYLAAVRADAEIEAAKANVELSEAVLRQSENQKAAGTGTGIEVTRARVQLAHDRQQLLLAENGRRSAGLQLLRAMNFQLDSELVLTDRLGYVPVDSVTLQDARAKALQQRPDLAAQQDREAGARMNDDSVRMERLPSVAAFGDWGPNGTGFNSALPTRTIGVAVRVPIFDGGRREARRAEAASQYRTEKIRTADLKEQIDLDVRLALDALHSAEEQVKVAREGLELAETELGQARRRSDAGVAASLEVTDAQTRLERARNDRIAALYNYNVARIDLGQAMGAVTRSVE